MARYRILPDRSRVYIDARSSLHPIHTETAGLEGWLELEIEPAGRVDVTAPAAGHLELAVSRLSSGHPLEDRELRRRIDARRYPVISGDLAVMKDADTDGTCLVGGDLTFRGVTRRYEDRMRIQVLDGGVLRLTGQATFDVRDFGMEPPRLLMFKVEPNVAVRVDIVAERQN
jgi:hypothetical protein